MDPSSDPTPPRFGLLDLLGAVLSTIVLVSVLLALAPGWDRFVPLVGGLVGFGVGWGVTRRTDWDGKLLLMPACTFAGALLAWLAL